jgi:hypothetical protein
VSRGERRKKEREEEEREREGSHILPGDSHHGGWRDSFMSRAALHGVTRSTSDRTGTLVTPQQPALLSRASLLGETQPDVAPHRHKATRLPHQSRQCIWRDCFMSRTNRTDVTQRGKILKISIGRVYFCNCFKKRTKKSALGVRRGEATGGESGDGAASMPRTSIWVVWGTCRAGW